MGTFERLKAAVCAMEEAIERHPQFKAPTMDDGIEAASQSLLDADARGDIRLPRVDS